ncbi:hypothetical protein K450DRAFT_216746 [Umbelopsis ramanniana AG]|uniref:DUF3291 domain-containing protein n=1 Tax=Umbelopsis ramanniana AG TaxID=1314678 RepID=A0AAD5HHC6_UMBRA|nr:uncharacterized protein K450DRAFT_216746 [Umbelopsis ramanniana AG]KAI8584522.1 hypothetical protein K450DRAFT_216746 [Umbelopsis ramanniana AG]
MTKKEYELAQLNVGLTLAKSDDPTMAGFYDNLDRINALAEASPGFVWRLQSDEGNATDIKLFDNELMIVNASVWESKDALFQFVYRSAHKDFVKQRKQWFAQWDGPHMVLWWVEKGVRPTPEEAKARLEYLAKNGPTPHAFTFRSMFPAPDE